MSQRHIARVRRICLALAEASERLSHGEPTFFVHKKVFVMFANNHHGDGRVAVWLPAPPGVQAGLIAKAPEIFFRPPYVGGRGWVGIELKNIGDDDLSFHIQVAWELSAPKRLLRKPLDEAGSRSPNPDPNGLDGLSGPREGSPRNHPHSRRREPAMKAKQGDPRKSDLPDTLAAPARRALAGAGIASLAQLSKLGEAEVKRLHGIGPNALDQLRRAMQAKGLAFAGKEK